MMKLARLLLIVAYNVPAWSAVIYTNLGPGDSYSNSSYTVYSGSFVAAQFVPSDAGVLDTLRLPLLGFGFNGPSADLLISLRVPSPDPNGAVIESWVLTPADVSPPAPPPGNLEVLPSSLHPVLAAGSVYWLRLESAVPVPFESYGWPQNETGDSGPAAISLDQGMTWATGGVNPAFEVNAQSTTPIPEPISGLLLGLGLLIVIVWRLRTGIEHVSR